MVSPAMTLAIYFFVFSILLDNKMPNFVIYLFAGLLVWNLFSLGVLTGTGAVVGNAGIVKKVSFPREILALAAVGSACVFFFFQAIVMVIFMVILRAPPDVAYFPLLILALIAGVIFASGLAVLLSSINVYLRDTQHLIEVILTAWFWACPIVYSYQTVEAKLGPRHLTWLYLANPMTPLVVAFQRCLYNKPSRGHQRCTHSDPAPARVPLVRRARRHRARPRVAAVRRRPRHLRPARGKLRRGALSDLFAMWVAQTTCVACSGAP